MAVDEKELLHKGYDHLDLLKGLAIFFVVYYHTSNVEENILQSESVHAYIGYYIGSIMAACVPLFFFVNGYLLLNSDVCDWKKYKNKLINSFVLTIVWAAITVVSLMVIREETAGMKVLFQRVWVLEKKWTTHLWFFKALFVLYVFYPILYLAKRHDYRIFSIFGLIVFVFTIGDTAISDFLKTVRLIFGTFATNNFSNSNFGDFSAFQNTHSYSIFYFVLGGIVSRYEDRLRSGLIKTIALGVFLISTLSWFLLGVLESLRTNRLIDLVWDGYGRIFTFGNVMALYILCLGYTHQGLMGRIIRILGRNTLGIYVFHLIVFEVFRRCLPELTGKNSFSISLTITCLVISLSLGMTFILKKLPFANRLLRL